MPDLTRYWYRKSLHPALYILLPFSILFAFISATRRWLFRVGVIRQIKLSAPVIVVGNITVGGTGKTPFVIWLANFLQTQGYRPGVVSRGYRSKKNKLPFHVTPDASVEDAGDEAVLLAKKIDCPVMICVDRVAAARELIKKFNCNIVISDDGLQHYRLVRDIEIVMVDAVRQSGNGYLLPAGPLRESESRLAHVDFIVTNGGTDKNAMELEPTELESVKNQTKKVGLAEFPDKKIHAVAGIGNPQRFFQTLKNAGFDVIAHEFPDHHIFVRRDLEFGDSLPIFMTEKDAVKCDAIADDRCWYLRVTARINNGFESDLLKKLKLLEVRNGVEEDFTKHTCRMSATVKCKHSCD